MAEHDREKEEIKMTYEFKPASTAPRSALIDSVKPFNVRASCGHIVIRKMRESTAGIAYTPEVILDAPNGRACPTCEEQAGA